MRKPSHHFLTLQNLILLLFFAIPYATFHKRGQIKVIYVCVDCAEIAADGTMESGVYYIKPLYSACPIPVWCDMDTYPGGWTLLQRREGGAVSFNREWAEYRKGFGINIR